jgi:hypothetical protein
MTWQSTVCKFGPTLLAGVLLCGQSHAQFAQAEGTFGSRQVTVNVVLLDPAKGVAAVSSGLVQGRCSGSVSGIGSIAGRTLTFAPYVIEPGAESCRFTLEFNPQWTTVKVTQTDSCAPYHGAACEWSGQVATKKRR